MKALVPSLSVVLLAVASSGAGAQVAARQAPPRLPHEYVVDFVSTAATGIALNNAGDVVGTSYQDTGCGSFCLPPLETVVWRRGVRLVLPSLPGLTGITVRSINKQGWVAGFAGFPYTTTHAVVWRPVGNAYQAIDLGTLPGTTISEAIGIDDQGRVVGWSTTSNFPPNGSPFLWSVSNGMVNLSLQGYPDEKPIAMSPGGTVATVSTWYRLRDPGSIASMATPPSGFALGAEPTAINDAGDQARFLIRVSGQNLVYLYRYDHEGSWQQLSASPTGHLSRYGVGSINDARDVTATVTGTGVIAYGPDGVAQSLAALLSSAYPGSAVTSVGALNGRGEILAQVMLGLSPRLVRLEPAWTCRSGCSRVSDLAITAFFVPDPGDPTQDHCAESLSAHNEALVTLTVTTTTGTPLGGILVSGRFLDDYWTNAPVSGTTDASGVVSFSYTGMCGVGALAFLVDGATGSPGSLDKTAGIPSAWAIPQ